jgi:hypothetical protein
MGKIISDGIIHIYMREQNIYSKKFLRAVSVADKYFICASQFLFRKHSGRVSQEKLLDYGTEIFWRYR